MHHRVWNIGDSRLLLLRYHTTPMVETDEEEMEEEAADETEEEEEEEEEAEDEEGPEENEDGKTTVPTSARMAEEEKDHDSMAGTADAADVLIQLDEDETDFADLSAALLKMVNNAALSDLQFQCKDGGKVYASRAILAARCPVFQRMLSNGMAESKMAAIPLPGITAAGLLPTLEFLYTGRIVSHKVSLESAFQVLEAARFLMLDKVEKHVVSAINGVMVKVSSPRVLAAHLSRALEFVAPVTPLHDNSSPRGKGVQHKARCLEFYGCRDSTYTTCLHTPECVQHMVSCLRDCDDPRRGFLQHMSWDAMEVYLELSRTRNLEPVVSFREYLRFRDIVLWILYHLLLLLGIEEVLVGVLPDEAALRPQMERMKADSSAVLLTTCRGSEVVDTTTWGGGQMHQLQGILGTKVLDYMTQNNIDRCLWEDLVSLERIHPLILLNIIKPLGVVPPWVLNHALFFQAIHSGSMTVMKWVLAKHMEDQYEVKENGTLLAGKTAGPRHDSRAFVRANIPLNRSKGMYEFDVVIEELSRSVCIGVGGLEPRGTAPERDRAAYLVVSSGSRMVRFVDGRGGETLSHRVMLTNSRVRVHVDMGKRCCTFSVNGQPIPGIVQAGLCDEVFPFASCESPGKLRILLVSNPDFM